MIDCYPIEPRPRTGIYARTALPSATYAHRFKLARAFDGRCICVERPGIGGYDQHYWECVPEPDYAEAP